MPIPARRRHPARRGARAADPRRRAARSRPDATSTRIARRRGAGRRRAHDRRRDSSSARRAVLANVTPTQLYGRPLPDADPAGARGREPLPLRPLPTCRSTTRSRSRRAGRATSGSAAPRWCTSRPASTASRAPSTRRPAACCPPRRPSSSASRSRWTRRRAPDGAGLLWIQLQELPVARRAATPPASSSTTGEWTEELRERYADRIQARLARHIPNLEASIRTRVVLSPADLVGGERQPRARRPVRRRAQPRPELPLAAAPRAARARDAGRRALAHRRLDASRARASAAARARSSPRSSSARRCRSALLGGARSRLGV